MASYPKEIFLDNFHKEDPTLTEYCKLVAHYNSEKYTAPELMKEALVCVFLTRCLQVKEVIYSTVKPRFKGHLFLKFK